MAPIVARRCHSVECEPGHELLAQFRVLGIAAFTSRVDAAPSAARVLFHTIRSVTTNVNR
jgi:hypothetical protein